MEYVIENGEVLLEEEVQTSAQTAIVRTRFCDEKKLALSAPKTSIAINEVLGVGVKLFDWQDNLLSEDIIVTVTVGDQSQGVSLVAGEGAFDFTSEVAGSFEIVAEAQFHCKGSRLEVTVA